MRRGKESQAGEFIGIDALPGSVHVDNNRNPLGFVKRARQHLSENPEIIAHAREKGKSIYARTTAHGTELLVGTAAIGVTAVLVYEGGKFLRRRRHAQSLHPLPRRKKESA